MGRSCLYEYTSCKHMSAITIRKYVCLEHSKTKKNNWEPADSTFTLVDRLLI
jgi:hypothetical protein